MPKVSYSTMGFAEDGLAAALDCIASAGFTCIELAAVPHAPGPPIGPAATDIRRQIERRGLTADTLHAPLRENVLGAPTEPWRQTKADLLADYIRFAGELGALGIVIHPVPNPMFLPDGDIGSMYGPMEEAARRSLDELAPIAGEANVRILLENLGYTADGSANYPLDAMRQLRGLIDPYPPAQVGLTMDTGHAARTGLDPVAEIAIAADRLCGTHLQDIDMRADPLCDNHWVPTRGGLDWDGIRAALDRIGYRGNWTFEVTSGPKGETPRELVRQARAVASEWGL